MRGVVLALLAGWLAAAPAAELPVIREIVFEGNDTTRPAVMLREMVVKVGDPADPAKIERSRQGIQDLGLFKAVDARVTPIADGVRVTFAVEEKWYILPIPRLDANSEGENAYGVSVRWYNVDGRNHTLRANWTRRDEEKINKGESTSYSMSYSMPFVLGTPYGVSVSGGHSETPISDFGGYTESSNSFGVGFSRTFAAGPASQGFSTGLSLSWNRQDTEGPNAPAPYGNATALGLSASYRDVRDNLFSEEGITGSVSAAGAMEGAGSDYSFSTASARIRRYDVVGTRPHQNLNFGAVVGTYHGGPTEYKTYKGVFGLGGASVMRAYPGDFVVGDFFYHVDGEYLRPIVADWLRFLVVAEAGNAFSDASEIEDRVYGSIGLGLRVRLTFLVNVEVEAGVAWPLDGTRGARFYASKV
jgi:outer membrane protein assembly factor BamA